VTGEQPGERQAEHGRDDRRRDADRDRDLDRVEHGVARETVEQRRPRRSLQQADHRNGHEEEAGAGRNQQEC